MIFCLQKSLLDGTIFSPWFRQPPSPTNQGQTTLTGRGQARVQGQGARVQGTGDRGTGGMNNAKQRFEMIMKEFTESPCAAGYVFPAEWEQQEAVILSCPLNPQTWPDNRATMEKAYAAFASAISRFETVRLICKAQAQANYRELLTAAAADFTRVQFYDLPTNDAWCRDHGPIFIRQKQTGERAIVDFNYNAWGENSVPGSGYASAAHAALLTADGAVPLTCERCAGSNGAGTLRRLNRSAQENRNPGMDKAEVNGF